MAWTSPRTWVAGELVTAALMNAHVRDNLLVLKTPPSALYTVNEGADYTTASASFVDVDGTNLALVIVTNGGNVRVGWSSLVSLSVAGTVYLDIDVDGAREGGDDGIVAGTVEGGTDTREALALNWVIAGLSAASHTIKLQWKVSAGTGTIYAGAGTSNLDLHPQFNVAEIG